MTTAKSFRQRFPLLESATYLAACSSGPPGPDIDAALRRSDSFTELPWPQWEDEIHRSRVAMSELLRAAVDQVAVVPNATIGAYQAASAIDWSHRPKIVSSIWEFPSISQAWSEQRAAGAELALTGQPNSTITDLTSQYLAAIDDSTGLVSIPYGYYRTGAVPDLAPIVQRARQVGAPVFVDAYQSAGTRPIDVNQLGCDFLVTGTSKYLLGRPGIAYLYVREPATDRPPRISGWMGRRDPFNFDHSSYPLARSARRYEIATPSVAAAYAATAGLGLLADLDLAQVQAHVSDLVDDAILRLVELGEELAVPPPSARGPIVAIRDEKPGKLAEQLAADHRVVVSPRDDVVRAAFHYYNSRDDITALCTALRAIRDP